MSNRTLWIPALMVLIGVTACAAAPQPASVPATGAQASRVMVTGSRIPVTVDSRITAAAQNPAMQQITQQDLTLTGQTDLAVALDRISPALH